MKLAATVSAALLVIAPFAYAAPMLSSHLTVTTPTKTSDGTQSAWQVYSLREQPYENAQLRFSFLDPNSRYETDCETSLPMDGYGTCSDGSTTFIYGGESFQHGETWLSIQRQNMEDCTDKGTSSDGTTGCTTKSATGTLTLPGDFWQQPGWNSWVHPEALDVKWAYTS